MTTDLSNTPFRFSLFKVNTDFKDEITLSPGHWDLYEKLKSLIDDTSLVAGTDVPQSPIKLYQDLIDVDILEIISLTYSDWKERKARLYSDANNTALCSEVNDSAPDQDVEAILSNSNSSGVVEIDFDTI